MNDYKELDVWKRSIELVKKIYEVTELLPKKETYALSDQIRRSVISVPSNIAEGFGRHSTKEYIQFLYIALGSAYELETQIMITKEVGYLPDVGNLLDDLNIIKKMINSLISSLKRKLYQNDKT